MWFKMHCIIQHNMQGIIIVIITTWLPKREICLKFIPTLAEKIQGSSWWKHSYLRGNYRDFLGGAVVKNLPANAGDTGSSPGPGRSHVTRNSWAHVPQLLSLCSRACEPQLLSPRATARAPTARAPHQEEPLQWEACAPQQRVAPTRHNYRKPARQWRPNSAKNKLIN